MNKKIILGLPAVYGLGSLIKENLQYLGYEVIDLSFDYRAFKYKNNAQRLHNFFRKTFLRDKSFKDKLRFQAQQHLVRERLSQVDQKAAYAFIIRPDTYTEEVLKSIKEKSEHLIGYQWDGMYRFPWVEKYIPLFERFFVFDPTDTNYHQHRLSLLGNYYFTLPRLLTALPVSPTGAYFIGSFNRERKAILETLHPFIHAAGIPTSFYLYSRKARKAEESHQSFTLTRTVNTYEENLDNVKAASIVIDITADCHKGLSLRFYEGICFNKKIITNNPFVRYYDFYHPDNIFIYGQDDLDALAGFMNKPYQNIDPAIRQKYSFDNWIRYALNIPSYTAIPAPDVPMAINN